MEIFRNHNYVMNFFYLQCLMLCSWICSVLEVHFIPHQYPALIELHVSTGWMLEAHRIFLWTWPPPNRHVFSVQGLLLPPFLQLPLNLLHPTHHSEDAVSLARPLKKSAEVEALPKPEAVEWVFWKRVHSVPSSSYYLSSSSSFASFFHQIITSVLGGFSTAILEHNSLS